MKYIPALMIGTILLTGCTSGKDYLLPKLSLPEAWRSSSKVETLPKAEDSVKREAWWKQFHDPLLDQLIQKADAQNLDLKIAAERIGQARANVNAARSALLPSLDASASSLREANRIAIPGDFPGLTKPFNVFQAGFDATWELDMFGGKRRMLEAQKADYAAIKIARDEAKITLLAEVARMYVDIRHYQQQLVIAKNTIKAESLAAAIAKERFKVGSAPGNDMMRANAQLKQTQAQLPYYENLLAQTEYAMDALLAELPGTTHGLVAKPSAVPGVKQSIIAATPAAVIHNRPDIRIAERALAASHARYNAALARRYPDISLAGFFGVLNTESSKVLTAGSESWQGGSTLLFPLLNYGSVRTNIKVASSQEREALSTYQQSVFTALSDVERAFTAYNKQESYRAAIADTLKDNRHIADIAQLRYKEGMVPFLEVLDAERTLYQSESAAVAADALVTQNLIALYKSLGLG